MMAGGDGLAVAGGPALHIPVLGRHAVGYLKPRDGGVYIDGTFGAGGYTRAILAAADCKVIGIDRDQTAIALGADLVEQAGGRLTLINLNAKNSDLLSITKLVSVFETFDSEPEAIASYPGVAAI